MGIHGDNVISEVLAASTLKHSEAVLATLRCYGAAFNLSISDTSQFTMFLGVIFILCFNSAFIFNCKNGSGQKANNHHNSQECRKDSLAHNNDLLFNVFLGFCIWDCLLLSLYRGRVISLPFLFISHAP